MSVMGALLLSGSPSCGGGSNEGSRPAQGSSAVPGRQLALSFAGPNGDKLHYLLYLPRAYRRGGRRWPLLLYLHGADVLGSGRGGLRRLRSQGLPKAVERHA